MHSTIGTLEEMMRALMLAPLLVVTLAACDGVVGGDAPSCGDGTCDQATEDCASCAADCGACSSYCGDGTCEEGVEDCASCSADCGACGASCGDGACDAVEGCASCPADCGACAPVCGDGACDAKTEGCTSCPADCGACGASCGDGACDAALEDCTSCPADCGACAPYCGDGSCDSGTETCGSCQADCGPCKPTDPPPPKPPEPLKIVSYNVWHGNSKANFVAALKEFDSQSIDVVGFQELADKDKPAALAQKTGCSSCAFDAWIPGTPSQGGNVAIIWRRSRFSVVTDAQGKKMRYAVKVHGPEPVEDGAGGTKTTSKYVVYVFLKDKLSNRSIWVMNAHGLASVEGTCGYPSNKPKRLALYKKMMDTFKSKIKTKAKPVFVTGDYNVNYRCDKNVRHYRFPWKSFNSLNPKVHSNWQWHEKAGLALPTYGTHKPTNGGKRLIDYVFAKADPNVSYKGTAVWKNRRFGSDHAPVVATYLIKKK